MYVRSETLVDREGSEVHKKVLEASCKMRARLWGRAQESLEVCRGWSVGCSLCDERVRIGRREGRHEGHCEDRPWREEQSPVHAARKSCTFRGCCAADTFVCTKCPRRTAGAGKVCCWRPASQVFSASPASCSYLTLSLLRAYTIIYCSIGRSMPLCI